MTLSKDEIEAGLARLDRGFMTPDTARFMCALRHETEHGETLLDVHAEGADTVSKNTGEVIVETELAPGWYARLSASGYMDCTEWTGPFATQEDAQAYLVETFDDGEDGEDDEDGDKP